MTIQRIYIEHPFTYLIYTLQYKKKVKIPTNKAAQEIHERSDAKGPNPETPGIRP